MAMAAASIAAAITGAGIFPRLPWFTARKRRGQRPRAAARPFWARRIQPAA
ncbi:hypothetical protein HMPREF0731_2516, partial [Pseudoroseomonas cervicalis ATCC 49957]